MIDGPVKWGQPVRSRAPGIFVVEQSTPDALAMLEITAIRAWVDRVPTFQLDGKRPEPAAVADRLRVVLAARPAHPVRRSHAPSRWVRASRRSTARPSGDRRPHPGGHWLKTLKGVDNLRVWWAETERPRGVRGRHHHGDRGDRDPGGAQGAAGPVADPAVGEPGIGRGRQAPDRAHRHAPGCGGRRCGGRGQAGREACGRREGVDAYDLGPQHERLAHDHHAAPPPRRATTTARRGPVQGRSGTHARDRVRATRR